MIGTELLDRAFYGNATTRVAEALGVAVVTYAALMLIKQVTVSRLGRIAVQTANKVDDIVVDLIARTRRIFLIVIALYAGSGLLTLPSDPRRVTHVAAILAFLFQGALWGNGLIQAWLAQYALKRAEDAGSATAIHALGYLARIFLWGVLLLVALDNLGINITALVAGLGVGGIAVALAVQNILGDLFGALSIVLDKPFVIGDTIVVDQMEGDVEHVGLKTTRIRSLGGEQIVIANAELLKSRIRNFKRLTERRGLVSFTVPFETPAAIVSDIPRMVRDIVESQPHTRFARSHVKRFADHGLEIETVFFVRRPDYLSFMDAQQAITLGVLAAFERKGIRFSYPTRTVISALPASPAAPASAPRTAGA